MQRRFILLILLVVGLVFGLCWFFLPDNERTFVNSLSLAGTLASIVGLVIAYFQILSIKQVTEQTKEEVKRALDQAQEKISLVDLSQASKNIDEAQGYIRNEKYEIALLRMKDIKRVLHQVEHSQKFTFLTEKVKYQTAVTDFAIDLKHLNRYIYEKSEVNFLKVIENLESLSTLFIQYESEIKHRRHDE